MKSPGADREISPCLGFLNQDLMVNQLFFMTQLGQ
jgi:hypothetical protein